MFRTSIDILCNRKNYPKKLGSLKVAWLDVFPRFGRCTNSQKYLSEKIILVNFFGQGYIIHFLLQLR